MQYEIAVIGGGSWGTALSHLLGSNGHDVTMYVLEEEVIKGINEEHVNPLYLSDFKLPENVKADSFDNIDNITTDKILWVVPTQFSRDVIQKHIDVLKDKNIIIATKGIEIKSGKLILSAMLEELEAEFSILSGPSFAKEVAAQAPTAVSIASKNEESAEMWQKIFSNDYFRSYITDDVVGVEVGGALKNVIAVATGICDGLEFGNNARAGIITRGLAEITRLGLILGAKPETFMGLSGMGDLVLTCTGELSRNRQVGLKLAEGHKIEDIVGRMKMVAEGVYTAKAAFDLSEKLGMEMPITNEVYQIIYENKNVQKSVIDLMNRPLKSEKIED